MKAIDGTPLLGGVELKVQKHAKATAHELGIVGLNLTSDKPRRSLRRQGIRGSGVKVPDDPLKVELLGVLPGQDVASEPLILIADLLVNRAHQEEIAPAVGVSESPGLVRELVAGLEVQVLQGRSKEGSPGVPGITHAQVVMPVARTFHHPDVCHAAFLSTSDGLRSCQTSHNTFLYTCLILRSSLHGQKVHERALPVLLVLVVVTLIG